MGVLEFRFWGVFSMALTHNQTANAKPASRDYKLFDSKDLFLIVSPAGGKSRRFKYRFGQRERLLTLGDFPELGLVAAGRLAQRPPNFSHRATALPSRKRRVKLQSRAAAEATFRKLGEEWLADMEPTWSFANYKRIRNRLERDLYP